MRFNYTTIISTSPDTGEPTRLQVRWRSIGISPEAAESPLTATRTTPSVTVHGSAVVEAASRRFCADAQAKSYPANAAGRRVYRPVNGYPRSHAPRGNAPLRTLCVP